MPNDEIRQAFEHPLVRSEATAPGPRDRISLRDHVVEVEIGAFEVERGLRQRLRFDIVVEVAPLGDVGDDVDRILSYDRLAEAVATELDGERLALLETLAERVAARILHEPQAERVILRIQKLDRGPGDLGVEIVRARSDIRKDAETEALRPRVVLLGSDEAKSPGLGQMIDILVKGGAPLLLVAPPARAPRAARRAAQGRVNLLAADQGAWLLAARRPDLAVAATRTEVDWNLRRWTPTVWAPAKVSIDEGWLDADMLYRAIMFAWSLDAIEVVVIGPSLDGLTEAPLRVRRATMEEPLERDNSLDWGEMSE
ncbi:dihydroneopterin aldolase [Rubellimicrobium rubrum]|uniref:dihydroneopterin aldolase n=1 Tax=Rubellimicrobium rubrum TaxID=2585369 RepID=A0A5C4N181_9RHOB|nr:dihydroneopterin aldolase [Rubellimicrobium rubrum]TNC50064.1 dihydroneopterin aldolase [Rubellimicrobium rubrum]